MCDTPGRARASATRRSADRPRLSKPRVRSIVRTRAAWRSPSSTARSSTIDGSHKNPVTDGYICAKVRKFGERVYGPDRLLYPAVRKGRKGEGRFERVTWDEALELDRRSRCSSAKADARRRVDPALFLRRIERPADAGQPRRARCGGASARRGWRARVCAAPTGAANMALYGKMPSVTYQDYPEAQLIVLWGVNPSASGIHLVPYVREAQKRGAKLVVIDPRTTPLARSADVHLAVRPGTDVAVALAIHRYLFANGYADEAFLREHTRGADTLRERAEPVDDRARGRGRRHRRRRRSSRSPSCTRRARRRSIRCGWGLERNRNGGNAAMAVLALPAVGGKFGVRGGGYSMSNSASWNIDRPWIGAPEPDTRIVNMNHLGRALTEYDDPPVNVLFVYNCNPAATVPDQQRVLRGLEREDLFTVVFEQVMTDTALYADVVLPATTFLEGYDFAKALRADQPRSRHGR